MIFDKSVVCPVLIGREDDLQRLDRLISASQAGTGQIALISGEAGIGKSRFIREAKARAPQENLILEGHCFQTDSTLPYAPLLDLFRNYFDTHSPEEIAQATEVSAAYLVKLFPELTVTLPGPSLAVTSTPEPEGEKRLLFQALAQTITALAQQQPLIIILEDLHWSDSTSLEFLLLLARRFSSHRILLLLTYRSEDTTPELTHFLAELDRERIATEFAFAPMSPPEVDQMLQAILDSPQTLSRRELLDAIFPLTEGNPFFIEEILKALITDGAISYADGAWDRREINLSQIPRTIKDAVYRRTQQFDEGTRQALTLASVMGRRFDFRLLQELLNVNEADLMKMLKEMIGAQLVVEETADCFAFRHALTREAVYSTLLLRERQGLHLSVAEAIERLYANSIQVHTADLSFHYYTGGAWQKALAYSRNAGDQARSLYSQREAVVYYSRALVAARQLDIPIEPALIGARGHAYDVLGDLPSALDDFEQALKLAREQQDGRAEWQTLTDLGFLWAGRDYEQTGHFFRQAKEQARKLQDPGLLAHSLNHMGHWCYIRGHTRQALECHRQALEIFEREEDKQGMAEARQELGMAGLHHGDQIGAYQEFRQAIQLFRTLDDKHGLIDALTGTCHTLSDDTDFIPSQTRRENQQMGMEALELARQSGWTWGEAFAEWGLAIGWAHGGRFEEALTHARAGFQIAAEVKHPQQLAGARYALGYIYVQALQADLAIEHLEAGLALANQYGLSAWLVGNTATELANAYLLKADFPRVRHLLDSFVHKETGPYTRAERRLLWAKGNLLLAEKKPAEALRIAELLLDSKNDKNQTQPIPALLMLKGEALSGLKQFKKAGQALEKAKQGAEQREVLPLLWQIHRLLGELYRQQRNMAQSEEEFASARQVLHNLAANIQDERFRTDFLQAGLERLPKDRQITRRQREAEKFGGLTAREREIAWIVSQGKSNREIAEGLILSERTVENHISNILMKLGFTSRAQIAVWAVEAGLGETKN